ncbi:MAG: PD-(D/E)XK nuclease family protein [Ichthyobacteriaceae bacterium]|nr:PD-(D/E)XK nuclease family protein [Ichthyobacteriaceae bacterium]
MQSFISQVVSNILESDKEIENQTIVLPSRRAGVFMKNEIHQQSEHAIWSPKIITIEEFIEEISGYKILDNITLLFKFYQVYDSVSEKNKIHPDDRDTFDQFSKWASIALFDFNEIDRYLIDSDKMFSNLRDVKRIESWTPNDPTKLMKNYLDFWNQLEVYYHELKKTLNAETYAFQGMAFRNASNNIADFITNIPDDKHFNFVGFNALTSAETSIITAMLNAEKANIYWDADSYYYKNPVQEAGMFLRKHKNSWDIFKTEEFNWIQDNFSKPKNIEIIGVPKMIGQAKMAGQILEDISQNQSPSQLFKNTAVVLSDENLLLPTLNSLPDNLDKINITMGFPIKSTPIAGFFDLIFDMQNKATKLGRTGNKKPFYHKDVISVLKHPLLNEILNHFSTETEKTPSHIIKQIYNHNLVFIGKQDVLKFIDNDLLKIIFTPWDNKSTTAINNVINIITYVKSIYTKNAKDYELDLEYLFRFSQIFNQLKTYNEVYPFFKDVKILHSFFKQILGSESLSFRGEPLEGLQLMGVLETRVLDFETIIMTSVNEGVIPASDGQNSFIPYDLKLEEGLPTYKEKDALYAYHFYRLIQRAKNIFLLYNTESDDFGAGEPSRFITQILHETKGMFNITESLLSSKPSPTVTKEIIIPKNKEIVQRLIEIGDRGYSPSALSLYMRNPLEFYYRRILRLDEQNEVEETAKPNTLGTVIHGVLEDLYKPFVSKYITDKDINNMFKLIDKYTKIQFQSVYQNGDISHGKNLLAYNVAKGFVSNFLKSELILIKGGRSLKIVGLEADLTASIDVKVNNQIIKTKIRGSVDRIDILDGVVRVLDYKSGKVEPKDVGISTFDEITNEEGKPKALQLMAYAMMVRQNFPEFVDNELVSGIISLKNTVSNNTLILSKNKVQILETEDINGFGERLSSLIEEIMNIDFPFKENVDL